MVFSDAVPAAEIMKLRIGYQTIITGWGGGGLNRQKRWLP